MVFDLSFFLNALLLGAGLAMDAFSVSVANGLRHAHMPVGRMCLTAGVFAGFQTAMPLIGWFFVHAAVTAFAAFSRFVPYIALFLLLYIGGGMLWNGIRNKEEAAPELTGRQLFLQGVATSIDALSVGFTTASFTAVPALVQALLIGAVTFVLCFGGLALGKRAGARLRQHAAILGGVILIGIGLEIFIKGVFFD